LIYEYESMNKFNASNRVRFPCVVAHASYI
jgi:hypothetical protein